MQVPVRTGELIGVVGAFVYIGGFFLLQTGRICGNSVTYALSKVAAASLVLVSLATAFNLAACVIQIAYAAIGGSGMDRPADLGPPPGAGRPVGRNRQCSGLITLRVF